MTHTNDLASLALTCSAMHAVVTPMIYNRFDIVWPDSSSSTEPRTGVDALTYGLATLVMREDLFENAMLPATDPNHAVCSSYSCTKCGAINYAPKTTHLDQKPKRPRRGNFYSQFTKKFSLGNGPTEWVQEYLVTKESGKMLGTLICLAIARMPNLESFVWDMPTGILRDIWIALASLGDYKPSKLSKVWVRLHDNKQAVQESGLPSPQVTPPPLDTLGNAPLFLSSQPNFSKLEWSNQPTENPNFSILPPLRSLNVFNIDELSYFTELSDLIWRSRETLRELRIGVASKVHTSGFESDHPCMTSFCAGGDLWPLLGGLREGREETDPSKTSCLPPLTSSSSDDETRSDMAPTESPVQDVESGLLQTSQHTEEVSPKLTSLTDSLTSENSISAPSFDTEDAKSNARIDPALTQLKKVQDGPDIRSQGSAQQSRDSPGQNCSLESCNSDSRSEVQSSLEEPVKKTSPKWRLDTLELEGCYVNFYTLRTKLDFQTLTTLTLLNCRLAERFWSGLGRLYPPCIPRQKSVVVSSSMAPFEKDKSRLRRVPNSARLAAGPQYSLSLKRIHTDNVTPGLIIFLKESLAPNSIEWLFLQDSLDNPSPVSVDSIVKGPIRRHRASLAKVMIDSSVGPLGSRSRLASSQKWLCGREILTFITSGKINKLRELAIVIEYKDWHFFLQHLPNIPHLRSLYVPDIVNHVYGSETNVKELAMGVLDVISLRPVIELCYLAISTKCFEITEKTKKCKSQDQPSSSTLPISEGTEDDSDEDLPVSNEDATAAPQDSAQDDTGESSADQHAETDGGLEEEDWSSSEGENSENGSNRMELKLREILFYDDKISIFKARHARL